MGLVCQENPDILVPSFRVLGIARQYDELDHNTMFIETYSSITGKWKPSKLVCTDDLSFEKMYHPPLVCNGVFHWYTRGTNALAVYDSNLEDEKYVQLIKLPFCNCIGFVLTRSSRDNVLWVGMSRRVTESMRFWMLPKDGNGDYKRKTTIMEDEWVLPLTIDVGSLTKEMMMVLESKKRNWRGWYHRTRLWLYWPCDRGKCFFTMWRRNRSS